MIDNERSLADLTRLHDDIMRERAAGLHEAAASKKDMLVEREEALARLRLQVAMLKKSLHGARAAQPQPAPRTPSPITPSPRISPPPRAFAAPVPTPAPVRPVPAKEAFPDSATVKASPARTGLSVLAPYLAIAACAAFVELTRARRAPAPTPDLADLARPAPAIVANGHAAAKGAPVVSDDDRSQEALLLVHEWKLPGDEKTLGDRLGEGMDLPGGRPAWSVDRVGENGYRVTYQPGADSPAFSFEADLAARVVWPTAETQELLAPRVAALRDAAR
jgi:hypothetical protein